MKLSPDNDSSKIFYGMLWNIFLKRKILFITILFCFILGSISISVFFPRYYSEAMLIVQPNGDPTHIPSPKFDIATNESFLSTQISLLSSRPILSQTLSAFYKESVVTEKRIKKLKSSLSLKHIPLNNLVVVKLDWCNKEEVRPLLAGLLSAYREWFEDDVIKESQQVDGLLHEQMLSRRKELEESEENLDGFLRENLDSAFIFPELYSSKIKRISELKEQLKYQKNELSRLLKKEEEITSVIKEQRVRDLIALVEKEPFSKLETNLRETQTQFLEITELYEKTNSKVIDQEFVIKDLRKQIMKNLESSFSNEKEMSDPTIHEASRQFIQSRVDLLLAHSTVAHLEEMIHQLITEIEQFNHVKIQKHRFERINSVLEAWFLNFQHKIQDNKIFLSKKKSAGINVISPPTQARHSNRPLEMSLYGLLSGALFNLVLLYLLTYQSKYVYTHQMVSWLSGKPVIATIPLIESKEDKRPLILNEHSGNFGLTFDRLAAQIILNYSVPFSLHITSTSKNSGKSMVAINLGIAMAKVQESVLIIDCDENKFTSYESLKNDLIASDQIGIYLINQFDLADTSVPNLKIGKLNTNPQSSGSIKMNMAVLEHLLNDFQRKFPIVIFDSLPLLDHAVPLFLCKLADTTIVVTRPKIEMRDRIIKTFGMINSMKTDFPGWVINEK